MGLNRLELNQTDLKPVKKSLSLSLVPASPFVFEPSSRYERTNERRLRKQKQKQKEKEKEEKEKEKEKEKEAAAAAAAADEEESEGEGQAIAQT